MDFFYYAIVIHDNKEQPFYVAYDSKTFWFASSKNSLYKFNSISEAQPVLHKILFQFKLRKGSLYNENLNYSKVKIIGFTSNVVSEIDMNNFISEELKEEFLYKLKRTLKEEDYNFLCLLLPPSFS